MRTGGQGQSNFSFWGVCIAWSVIDQESWKDNRILSHSHPDWPMDNLFSWAIARARRANASFFRNLFSPHEIFSPTAVRPERTHSSCSLVEKLCAPGKGWIRRGPMALCSCSIYRLLLYTPVACNKTKPLRLQSPRRFDRVVLSAPSFCLSWKLLLDRSLLSKQKGSSES